MIGTHNIYRTLYKSLWRGNNVHYTSLCEFINVKTQREMIQKIKYKAGTHLPAYTMPQTAVWKHTCKTSRIDPNMKNITGMEKSFHQLTYQKTSVKLNVTIENETDCDWRYKDEESLYQSVTKNLSSRQTRNLLKIFIRTEWRTWHFGREKLQQMKL